MVRHIVAWNFAEGLTEEEKSQKAAVIKKELENLKNLIEGIVSIEVLLQPLDTSESDLMLDSVFTDEKALKSYTIHPEHVRVASTYVRPATRNRKCIDFNF